MAKNRFTKTLNILFQLVVFYGLINHTASFAKNAPSKPTFKKSNNAAIISIDTKKTILKVRTATFGKEKIIIGSSYEGIVLAYNYNGEKLWENKLSGFMNHDLWTADLDNDGNDEILTANADGTIYCIDSNGITKWKFQNNEVPMYSICTIKKENKNYIVAGGFDLSMYYLSSEGKKIKQIPSSSYSIAKAWKIEKKYNKLHYANFLRPAKKDANNDILVVHGSNNHMQSKGVIYLFEALADKPYKSIPVKGKSPIGELRILDVNDDNTDEIVLGSSSHQNNSEVLEISIKAVNKNQWKLRKIKSRIGFGYSVLQPELIKEKGKTKYALLVGNRIILTDTSFDNKEEEEIKTTYSYYDSWKDNNNLILASAQSGGSCIHIIDLAIPRKLF